MSAIAGIIQLNQKPINHDALQRMQTQLAPYGRDAQHLWQQGSAGFLRTLLRTTPEDSFDQQPLVHYESGLVLLFAGRLDNREELASKLRLNASRLRMMADSDIALQACLHWDIRATEHLLGSFAIACWHSKQRKLWLARDPLGHAPLFWHKNNNFFAFATMPKALFTVPDIPRTICEESLANALAFLPQAGGASLYKDVYRVEPGQILALKNGNISTHHYHEFDPGRELQLGDDDEYLEAFREHLDQAIACRLRSSGSIASHLSSGFDSSTVTALAATQLQQQNKPLLAYTSVPSKGFSGEIPRGRSADESISAGALTKRFNNISHILVRPDEYSVLDSLKKKITSSDQTPRNPCNVTWMEAINADAQSRQVKVLLTGQMGNMSISYTGEEYLSALIANGSWKQWWEEAATLKQLTPNRSWKGLLAQSIGPNLPPKLWLLLQKIRGNEWLKFTDYTAIHPQFLEQSGGARALAKKAGWDFLYRPWVSGRHMRIAGINRFDPGENFAAINTYGMEMRDPTSDLRLIEFCLSVPDHQYLRKGQTRWLLHRLMKNTLPPEILHPKTKGLQSADWYKVVEADLPRIKEDLARMVDHGVVGKYIDLDALQQSLESWPESGWHTKEVIQTYRLKLLRGIAVGTFISYVEGNNYYEPGI